MDIGEEHEKQIIEPIKNPVPQKPDTDKPEPVREEPVKPRKEPVKV